MLIGMFMFLIVVGYAKKRPLGEERRWLKGRYTSDDETAKAYRSEDHLDVSNVEVKRLVDVVSTR